MAPKIKKCCFLTALNQKVLQDIKKSFEDVHLDAKIYWISPASLWNSTTVIMLICTILFGMRNSQFHWRSCLLSSKADVKEEISKTNGHPHSVDDRAHWTCNDDDDNIPCIFANSWISRSTQLSFRFLSSFKNA